MKTKKHLLHKFSIKTYQILFLILLTIAFFCIYFFIKFNQKVTPKLLNVAEASINKLNETILTNFKVKDIYPKIDLENAILLTKNTKDEIISVDFDMETVYKGLSLITEYLQKSVEDENIRKNVLNFYNEDISSKLDKIILTITENKIIDTP